MPEGVSGIADMTIIVDAQIEKAVGGLNSLEGIIERIAVDGTQKFGFFDSKIAGIAGTVGLVAGRFNVWLQGAQALMGAFDGAMARAEKIAPIIGAEQQFTTFKEAVDELAAQLSGSFDDALAAGQQRLQSFLGTAETADARGKPTREFLDAVTQKATEALKALTALAAYAQEPENRTVAALITQLRGVQDQLRNLDAGAFTEGDPLGQAIAAGLDGAVEALAERRGRLVAEKTRLEEVLFEKQNLGPWEVSINLEGMDRTIEGLQRQNQEMEIRRATIGMTAGEAARLGEILKRELEYGERLKALTAEQRAEWDRQIALRGELAQFFENQRKSDEAARRDQRFDNDLQAAEREIGQMRARTEQMGQGARAVAEATMEEKLLAAARRDRVELDESDVVRIKAIAAEFGKLAEQQDVAKRSLQNLQDYAREFSSSMEQAFTQWIKTGRVDWQQFFNELSADIAKLALRQGILAPLFGGGQGGGAGLFGSLLGAIGFGGARAGGGDAQAGMAYQWQEGGREYFVPEVDGAVLPAAAVQALAAAASGGPREVTHKLEVTQNVNFAGAFGREDLAAAMEQTGRRAVAAAVQQVNDQFPARWGRLLCRGNPTSRPACGRR